MGSPTCNWITRSPHSKIASSRSSRGCSSPQDCSTKCSRDSSPLECCSKDGRSRWGHVGFFAPLNDRRTYVLVSGSSFQSKMFHWFPFGSFSRLRVFVRIAPLPSLKLTFAFLPFVVVGQLVGELPWFILCSTIYCECSFCLIRTKLEADSPLPLVFPF